MPVRRVYLLSRKTYSAETIAVAFAKTSRSPLPFDAIAAELNEAAAASFHEKWVVGYGHASVAEHAVLHLALENISRVAVEAIESGRLASYTEKSTRYQQWEGDAFFTPPELRSHPLLKRYQTAVRHLFAAYAESLKTLRAFVRRQNPPQPGEEEPAWDRRIRSRYADVARFLLPAASLANVGMTVNARALEHALRKWLSHPLLEVQELGAEVRKIATEETPTLVKYARPQAYLLQVQKALGARAAALTEPPAARSGAVCRLENWDPDGEDRVLAAALYRFSSLPFARALAHVRALTPPAREALAADLLADLGRHDVPLRELEHTTYTFDLVMDQGAYAEFKRHRMMSQTPQRLTASLGYALPRMMAEAGLEAPYRAAMDQAADTWADLAAWNADVAQYVVPNGFYRRVLATFNLREAFHFCRLRAAPNAHFSIRWVARRVHEEIARVHPLLARYLRLPEGEHADQIKTTFFA